MMIAVLLGSLLFLCLLHCLIRYRRGGRLINLIPGPKGYPIIGNILEFLVDDEHLFEKVWALNKQYSPLYKIWSFFYYGVMIMDPEDIQVLLKSNEHIEKGTLYRHLKPWLSTGLLLSGGQKWHIRRKMLTPTFHFNILKYYLTIVNEKSQNLVESLKKEADGNPVVKNIRTFITEYTLTTICKTALGIELTGNSEMETKYCHAVHDYGKIVAYRLSRPWYFFDSIFGLTSLGRVQKELLKTLHNLSRTIIAERKAFHKQTDGKYLQSLENIDDDDVLNKDLKFRKTLSLLDLLIAESWKDNRIDEEGIREEVDTFMFEGHDTTSSALSFALSLFAKHKDVQENIRAEVSAIMQEDNNLTISSVQKLSYLERCIKESLRLYPSVHVISRQISHDMQLKHYLIPSGTVCIVSIYNVHRNPEYWPNPNVFNPDRFLPENINGRHLYSYIPFSAGPRNCIGQKFAMHELKVTIASILYNFKLEPVDELDDVIFAPEITLTSLKPFRVKFIPIT